jgi:hypothetical protein
MGAKLPNGAKAFIGSTFGARKIVTAFSNELPATASSAAHGLLANAVVRVLSNWSQLNGRVVKVGPVETDEFGLQGIDTEDELRFPTGGGAGSVIPVTGWTEITQITDISPSGGEQGFAGVSFLDEADARQLPSERSARSMVWTLADDPNLAWNDALRAADASGEPVPLKVVLKNGDEMYYGGFVSFDDQPTLAKNNVMVVKFTFAQDNPRMTRYPKVL